MAQHHDTLTEAPSHTPGTAKGEKRSSSNNHRNGAGRTRSLRDATGINSKKREPIDPRMPELPPA